MKFMRKAMGKWKIHGNGSNRQNHRVNDMDMDKDMGINWKPASKDRHVVQSTKAIELDMSFKYANDHLDATYDQKVISFKKNIDTTEKVQGSYVDEATRPPKILSKCKNEDYMSDGSFHQAVGRVFLVAQFFGMMPIQGVTTLHSNQLYFSWMSIRTWFSLTFIMMTVIDLGLVMYKVLNKPITFNTVEPIIFDCSIIVVCTSALNLARKWPTLMQYWHKVERDLPPYATQMAKSRLAYQIRMVTFVAMMLSLCEHLLSLLAIIKYADLCPITDNPIKNFLLYSNDKLFNVFEFSNLLAVVGTFGHVVSVFIWTYMDVFVMIVSIGLASMFRQLNYDLSKFKGMHMSDSFWSQRRIQYRSLCVLCDKIDNAISVITMISFSNNLYFICVQLLKSLVRMPSMAHALYFYFSLSFLLGRTVAVSLYTSSVHDESRKPLRVLRCVPKGSWCPEVKRFAEEVSGDLVALSGMKFFHLTRNMVLSVAGTIVTYELVLIQFHEDNGNGICPNNTTKN